MEYIYDVFIAYHGTFSSQGTYKTAKLIADFLKSRGFSVYLHGYMYSDHSPLHKDTQWNHTWERINESKTFLLVINDNVPKKTNGALGNDEGQVSQIGNETDRFSSLVIEGKRNKHDFNWFYCGNLLSRNEQFKFLETLYNPLTDGHNCLFLGQTSYEAIETWLKKRLSISQTNQNGIKEYYYDLPYADKYLKIINGDSFTDAYEKANFIAQQETNNLIITIKLSLRDFYSVEFPYKEALKKADVLRRNSPNKDNLETSDFEFQLYHGDYIIIKQSEQDDKVIDGYEYAKKELKRKNSSRRALISLINTRHIVDSGDKPIPSFMLAQFQIKNNTLIVTEYFRAMEIGEFFKINMGETHYLVKDFLSALPDVKEIFITYHIFDAYVSDKPKSSLYIPLMDRADAQFDIIPAIKDKDINKLIVFLEDKLYSKIFNITIGFENFYKGMKKFETFDKNILNLLQEIIEKGKSLEKAYAQSNASQNEIILSIEQILKKIIFLMRGF